nr:hypothetical protein [Pseudomonadales bacterium]
MTTDLAIPLDQRFEFSSADWVREANRFLAEQRESINRFAQPVSLSVALDQAPTHLSSTDHVGYTIVL